MTCFSYKNGVKGKRSNKDRRVGRVTIVIDETGDLGNSPGPYIMVATVVFNVSNFNKVSNHFPNREGTENKNRNTNPIYKMEIMKAVSMEKLQIFHYCVDKEKEEIDLPEQKKKLYLRCFKEIITRIFSSDINVKTFDILIDDNSLGNGEDFLEIIRDAEVEYGKEVCWCERISSSSSKTLQIADFITGCIGAEYSSKIDENNYNSDNYRLIEPLIK